MNKPLTKTGNSWPDLLFARLLKANISNLAIGNQAAGGNAILSGGLGPTLLARYRRDAIQQQGVKYVLIFEGVNDIGSAGGDISSQLTSAYATIARDCKAAGLKVFGATITPFGGPGQSYYNPTREATRVRVNSWILANSGPGKTFDAAVDFAGMVEDRNAKTQLARDYDGGDHLHLSVRGYQAMADGFPLDIFV